MSAAAPNSPHLLVVEADPALRSVFQEVLAEMGYTSTSASSLKHALRVLNQRPFDLIVADTSPDTSQDALASLRPLLALSHPLPVILCTALPLSETAVRQEGFAGLVAQPFDLNDLVTTVAECLHQPWSPDQLRQAEVVQRFVASFIQRDVEALVALCTEEVRFYPWIVPALPRARPVTGRAALRAYLQEAMQYLGAYQVDDVHLSPCPHGIAMRLLLGWQEPAGAPKQQIGAWCVKVTPDGQISQLGLPWPDERLLAPLSPLRGV